MYELMWFFIEVQRLSMKEDISTMEAMNRLSSVWEKSKAIAMREHARSLLMWATANVDHRY